MRDLVLVPAFARPEYLFLCIEHVRAISDADIWVAQDAHVSDSPLTRERMAEVKEVAEQFGVRFIQREPHSYIGNPYNFLELYKAGFESDARFVYLVEDDVLVGPDFFRWHEAVQAKGNYLCSVGWDPRKTPLGTFADGKAEDYVELKWFTSIGVCWKRENLSRVVAHAKPEYYSDLPGYMAKTFPNSPIGHRTWTEQAGLINRIVQSGDELTAWPLIPRCAHIGINGYHRTRGYAFSGTLEQRIEHLRQSAKNTERLLSLSRDRFDDVGALPEVPPWQELKVFGGVA